MKLSKFLTFTVFMAFMAVSLVGCDDDGGNNSNNVNNNNNNQNAVCGNGILEGDEVCDGTDFGDVTCESRGFTGGTLSCSDDCSTIDDSQCEQSCENACTNGTLVCNGDILRSCETDSDTGCTVWVDTDCTTNGQVCDVIDNVAQCVSGCTDNCTENEVQCDGDVLQTCEVQANGCTDWSDTTDCSANGEICDVVSGTAQCTAGCTDNCTEGELQCDGDMLQTCEIQGNGCTDWSDTTDCANNGEICTTADGTPVCAAPGVYGSCDNPITVTLPYTIDGTNLPDDFSSNEEFDGTDCGTAHGVEAVFAVNLQQDATLIVEDRASGDFVLRILATCDASNSQCLESTDSPEYLEFVAPADGVYYVVLEAYYDSATSKPYDFVMYTIDASETYCDDGLDNDGDGDIDCDDTDCFGIGQCTVESNCSDGLDNDGDGDTDCDDSECAGTFECTSKKGIYEQFGSSNPVDLEGFRIVYTPDGAGNYTYAVTADATFFVEPGSTGDATFANADSSTYHISLPFTFNFYGTDYTELWATSNGVMVFDATPSSSLNFESTTKFFEHPTLAVMWDDLTYITTGDVLYTDHGTDGTRQYWAFTYTSKEYSYSNYFTAQVVLFDDGEIRVDYITNTISDGIVGISNPGNLGTVNPVNFNMYPSVGEVIITEIMYDTDQINDATGEYVEFYNTKDTTIKLTGCELTDSETTVTIGNLEVPAHSYVVFVRSTDPASNGGITDGQSLGNIALGNSGDDITLSCNGYNVDTVVYTDKTDHGTSIQLDPSSYDAVSNDNMANWCGTINATEFLYDGSSNYGTPGAPNHTCPVTIIYSEDFESDPSWTLAGDWEWGTPDATSYSDGPSACADGSGCYGTNMDGEYTLNKDYSNNYIQMPVLDLSSYSTSDLIKLQFAMWLVTENSYDFARIEVSTDGSTFSTLADNIVPAYNHSSSEWMGSVATTWTDASVSLSSYAGNATVYVRFALESDYLTNKAGFYIDNVRVTVR